MSAVQEMPVQHGAQKKNQSTSTTRTRILQILTVLSVLGIAYGSYMALAVVGEDATQGAVQRIFYFHVPAFFGAFIAFSGTVIGGIMYLLRREVKWDVLALSGVEVGLTLSLINLITGSIWAKPIWNTWWTWDPRLTSAAIMCLTYAAYLMLRNGIENPETRRRFASVYGILAMGTVIFTFIIIRIRPDTIHPLVIEPGLAQASAAAEAEGSFTMSASIGQVLGMNIAIWGVLVAVTLIWWRIRLQNIAEYVQELKATYLS